MEIFSSPHFFLSHFLCFESPFLCFWPPGFCLALSSYLLTLSRGPEARWRVALLPKLKTKDKAKSVRFFWEKDQPKLCTSISTSSIFLALSPLFTLAQIICKNLSYLTRIVEREGGNLHLVSFVSNPSINFTS